MKHFLEYAERGPSALGAAVYGSVGDFESPFESAIARALRDKGWNVHPQVGVSAYRIDLGIAHPDEPGIYLAGIECDGAMYHSSAFARERDKIRQSVLEGLGWTLYRVWSTDWWTNRAKALDDLNEALIAHLETDRQKRKDASLAPETDSTDSSFYPDLTNSTDEDITDPTTSTELEGDKPVKLVQDFQTPANYIAAECNNLEPLVGELSSNRTSTISFDPIANSRYAYKITDLDCEQYKPDPDTFYSKEYEPRLSAIIAHVIDIEGPIHEDILTRRIARHHGFQRAGRQIREIVLTIASHQREWTKEDVGLFFWSQDLMKNHLAPARYKYRDEEMRKIEYICKEEIRAIGSLVPTTNNPVELAHRIGISSSRYPVRPCY